MNLDQLTIEIRPRRPWEAVDLGIRMAQRWWWPLTLIFILLSLPLWVAISFVDQKYWYWKLLAFWLFLPLLERPLLYFLSQAVFNDLLTVRAVMQKSFTLMWPQSFSSVSWRRLSPSRSMDMAVTVLEGLNGKRRSARLSVLHREDASPATWMSFISLLCIPAIALTLFLVLVQFISQFFDTPWWEFAHDTSWSFFFSEWAGNIIYHLLYVGLVLVTPFYVAAGFALYLNRRIRLEAWDVEIEFKKIVQKRQASHALLLVLFVGSFFALVNFEPAFAASTEDALAEENAAYNDETDSGENEFETSASREREHEEGEHEEIDWQLEQDQEIEKERVMSSAQIQARADIKAILDGEDFNQYEKKTRRRFPFDEDKENEEVEGDEEFFRGLEKLFDNIASLAEVLLWTLVISVIFFLIYRYRFWLGELLPERHRLQRQTPETLFGLPITEASLPDDVGASARRLWLQGQQRDALALLYRACLAQLLQRGLELRDGDTELECLRASKKYAGRLQLNTDAQDYFSRLTGLWRNMAYGHLQADENTVLLLCDQWSASWQVQQNTPEDNTTTQGGEL